jgi:hypothetical protein
VPHQVLHHHGGGQEVQTLQQLLEGFLPTARAAQEQPQHPSMAWPTHQQVCPLPKKKLTFYHGFWIVYGLLPGLKTSCFSYCFIVGFIVSLIVSLVFSFIIILLLLLIVAVVVSFGFIVVLVNVLIVIIIIITVIIVVDGEYAVKRAAMCV